MLQPLKAKERKPGEKGYESWAFATRVAGSLTYSVSVLAGYYAEGNRYVEVATGRETEIVPLDTQTATLSLEDGAGEAPAAAPKKAT